MMHYIMVRIITLDECYILKESMFLRLLKFIRCKIDLNRENHCLVYNSEGTENSLYCGRIGRIIPALHHVCAVLHCVDQFRTKCTYA